MATPFTRSATRQWPHRHAPFGREQFSRAGFRDSEITPVNTGLSLAPETYWEMITEIGAPIVAALGQADASTRAAIRQQVLEKIHLEFPDGNFHLNASALVISAKG